jgi:hypothetical protein
MKYLEHRSAKLMMSEVNSEHPLFSHELRIMKSFKNESDNGKTFLGEKQHNKQAQTTCGSRNVRILFLGT